jgi:hypothetical protein
MRGARWDENSHQDFPSHACTQHALNMHSACTQHALSMLSACTQHALSMLSACSQHALSMHSACTWTNVLQAYEANSKLTPRYTQSSCWPATGSKAHARNVVSRTGVRRPPTRGKGAARNVKANHLPNWGRIHSTTQLGTHSQHHPMGDAFTAPPNGGRIRSTTQLGTHSQHGDHSQHYPWGRMGSTYPIGNAVLRARHCGTRSRHLASKVCECIPDSESMRANAPCKRVYEQHEHVSVYATSIIKSKNESACDTREHTALALKPQSVPLSDLVTARKQDTLARSDRSSA